ncbi:MAG: type II and III secretion system protein family protein [bacterium]
MVRQHGVRRYRRGVFFFIILHLCLLLPSSCRAAQAEKAGIIATTPQTLSLAVGKSIVIESPVPVERVTLADPAVADVLILSPQQIYLNGKVPGLTNITLWSDRVRISDVFDLEVVPDITRLKEKLHEIFPQEENIRITATHDSLSLYGTVSSSASLSEILALVQSYTPKGKGGESMVNNFLEVEGVHQVMIEVQISEMSRSLIKELGINFSGVSADGTKFGVSLLDRLSGIDKLSAGESFTTKELGLSSNLNAIFRFYGNDVPWTVLMNALKDEGLVKVLAEPTLITLSGKPADFLAGGEFPIPVPQEGGITIEYKKFGVGLQFTPIVLSSGKINMEVSPEVSELDPSNSLSWSGFKIPGLSTRRVSTVIELGDGQSFAVAGLLKNNVGESVQKFPLLGDIPILGSLFRSSSFQKNETELIIIVTPHLVKPLDMAKQTLPTGEYREPDDLEFYFQGKLEGRGEPFLSSPAPLDLPSALTLQGKKGVLFHEVPAGDGLEGDFGHIVP